MKDSKTFGVNQSLGNIELSILDVLKTGSLKDKFALHDVKSGEIFLALQYKTMTSMFAANELDTEVFDTYLRRGLMERRATVRLEEKGDEAKKTTEEKIPEADVTVEPAKAVKKADPKNGSLQVTVKKGENLKGCDNGGKSSDPYVKLIVGNNKRKTAVKKNDLNPVWDVPFSFTVDKPMEQKLIVEVWDKDLIGGDNMGKFSLSINEDIFQKQPSSGLFLSHIENLTVDNKPAGKLFLQLKYSEA